MMLKERGIADEVSDLWTGDGRRVCPVRQRNLWHTLRVYLGDKPTGGQVISYSAEMDEPFGQGEVFTLSLTAQDFPENADLNSFGMEAFVVLEIKIEAAAGG